MPYPSQSWLDLLKFLHWWMVTVSRKRQDHVRNTELNKFKWNNVTTKEDTHPSQIQTLKQFLRTKHTPTAPSIVFVSSPWGQTWRSSTWSTLAQTRKITHPLKLPFHMYSYAVSYFHFWINLKRSILMLSKGWDPQARLTLDDATWWVSSLGGTTQHRQLPDIK